MEDDRRLQITANVAFWKTAAPPPMTDMGSWTDRHLRLGTGLAFQTASGQRGHGHSEAHDLVAFISLLQGASVDSRLSPKDDRSDRESTRRSRHKTCSEAP